MIYAELAGANFQGGANVTIGPGCEIDLVEYTGSLTGSNGVRSSRKVERTA